MDPIAPPRPAAPRRRRLAVALGAAFVALAAGAAAWHAFAGRRPAPPRAQAAQPVRTAPVLRRDLDERLDALGTVTALQSVSLHARVDGQLASVAFRDGEPVRAGQLLATIDPRPYEVLVRQAQAQLERDQAQLGNARADLARYEDLVAKDAAPRQQLDTQRALVTTDEAVVHADQAALASAQLNLSFTRIAAPMAGVIGLRQIDPGNLVHAADTTPLAVLAQTRPIKVLFSIPQERLPAVLAQRQAGASLPVVAFDRDGRSELAHGTLNAVDNQIDTTTGTVKLVALFDNADATLFPNQFVNVSLRVQQRAGQLVVPSAAVQRSTQGTSVFVVDADGHAGLRKVTLGAADHDQVAVAGGVEEGEQVVIDGADRLRDGSLVELAGADPQPAASAASGAGHGRRRAHAAAQG